MFKDKTTTISKLKKGQGDSKIKMKPSLLLFLLDLGSVSLAVGQVTQRREDAAWRAQNNDGRLGVLDHLESGSTMGSPGEIPTCVESFKAHPG